MNTDTAEVDIIGKVFTHALYAQDSRFGYPATARIATPGSGKCTMSKREQMREVKLTDATGASVFQIHKAPGRTWPRRGSRLVEDIQVRPSLRHLVGFGV